MVVGGLICVVGIGVTLATYSAASGGGRYVVAWGAIAAGAVLFALGAISALQHEAASSRTAAPAGGPGGDGRPAAGDELDRFHYEDRMLLLALASMVKYPSVPTAGEIGAICSIMQTWGRGEKYPAFMRKRPRPEVRNLDIHQALRERSQDPANTADWFRERLQMIPMFQLWKDDLLRGCFAVVLADGPRPDALATAMRVGQALGFTESEVKGHIRDITGPLDGGKAPGSKPEAKGPIRDVPLNGATIELVLKLSAAEAVGGREIEFHYDALALCAACKGSGCSACGEQGRTRKKHGLIFTLAPDVHDGMRLQWPRRGGAPLPGGEPGDLNVTIRVEQEPQSNTAPSQAGQKP